ncbi:MAG: elongation factor 4 [Clostridia bacterium]|nr:elongation factor 4 [Clostridia bacterium]
MKQVYDQRKIRNFCIIAHIDHGKSTLADRFLEYTGTLEERDLKEQVLDHMELERERGITIKMKAVRIPYLAKNGEKYILNLIDTPGHVDFSYEVSRSLAACEGAVLVVDAAQGIEAQTLANVYLAMENDLEIIPVVNKIDLPNADPEGVEKEIEDVLGIEPGEIIRASAKTGLGVDDILEAVVHRLPSPKGEPSAPLRALIFDSMYDSYKGAIPFIRVKEGIIEKGHEIKMMSTGMTYEVNEVGVFTPSQENVDKLRAGEVGYLTASIKNVQDTRVGDTITHSQVSAEEPLPGYQSAVPMVFCGLFPADSSDYINLTEALEKLQLNDASLIYEKENSVALGFGFRCGFLGLLHMEIMQERLEREYDLDLITTAPSVIYKVTKTNGEVIYIDNPTELPPFTEVEKMEEPSVKATIMVPNDYVGPVMELAEDRRGEFLNMEYITKTRVVLTYHLPMAEIIYDFFDLLKSGTRGFASLDYTMEGYKEADLVKVDILIAGEPVDALSFIVHEDEAHSRGRILTERLRKLIPRQLFEIPIQAAIGNKIIARENVKALRKNVLDKCYGGDITRKRKLLERQKRGKKRMKQVGNVEIPQEAFMAVLGIDE